MTARALPVIAIDGPAGAGKSTVAQHLARRFGLLNLETGAMYRAFALKALLSGTDVNDESALMALSASTRIMLEPTSAGNRVQLDDADVTTRIREADVTAAASRVSVHPRVREWMVAQQRLLGAAGGVVMEGRDIGTAVFPDAEVKIFLDAAAEVRGNRRFLQSPAASASQQETILRELRERDARDRNRVESPLRAADDSIHIDSTALTLDQVLARAEQIVRERSRLK
jgi:cytidylate kinase